MVLAVLGVATGAVINLHEMTAKPTRDWDAEIDRIIAQQQEKKRLAALASPAPPSEPAKLAAADAESQTAAEATTGAFEAQDSEAREQAAEKKAQTAAQSSKRPGRRNARRDHFLPAAFAHLPKFAATTAASTLLRLR